MNYVITWLDRDEKRYHVDGETNGTTFKEEADEFTKEEAEKLINANKWDCCTIEAI